MRPPIRIRGLLLLLVASAVGPANAEPSTVDAAAVVTGLRSADLATRQAARQQVAAAGASLVAPLFALRAEGDAAVAATVENLLFTLVGRATAPDAGGLRDSITAALRAELAGGEPQSASLAASLLGIAANGESGVLDLLLALHNDATREPARAALQRVPTDAATRALITGLTAASPADRPGFLRALGARRDAAALDPLLRWSAEGDPETRAAALWALGQVGHPRAKATLEDAAKRENATVRRVARMALLRFAEPTAGHER